VGIHLVDSVVAVREKRVVGWIFHVAVRYILKLSYVAAYTSYNLIKCPSSMHTVQRPMQNDRLMRTASRANHQRGSQM
jgi:hypothetical protein